MSLLGFLFLLFLAALIGSIGAALAGYRYGGCLTHIALGFIGAMIGSWLSRELGIRDFLYLFRIPVFWSIVGSALFVAALGLLTGGSRRRKKD